MGHACFISLDVINYMLQSTAHNAYGIYVLDKAVIFVGLSLKVKL